MSIIEDVQELKRLQIEIKRQQTQLRDLRTHKKECEKRIMDYLETNDQPGLKFRDMTIIAQNTQRRRRKKKQEKQDAGLMILQKHGIYNSKEALDELLSAMRGSPERETQLRIL